MTGFELWAESDDALDTARAWAMGNPEAILTLYLGTDQAAGDFERWVADQRIDADLRSWEQLCDDRLADELAEREDHLAGARGLA